jgi:hypothetical protein
MGAFGQACCSCIEEIISIISILGGGAVRLRFLAYGDYDTPSIVTSMSSYDVDARRVLQNTHIGGGADIPEASKTALNELLDAVQQDDAANPNGMAHAVFLFTDAPPHSAAPRAMRSAKGHIAKERARLGNRFDWLSLCQRFSHADIRVTTFLPSNLASNVGRFYAGLGQLVTLRTTTAQAIAEATVAAFSCMIGHLPEEEPSKLHILSSGIQYMSVKTEEELPVDVELQESSEQALINPVAVQLLGSSLLTLHKRLKVDSMYRCHVMQQIKPLLTPEHVCCLMTNPMLGKIWRALSAFQRHDEQVAALCNALSVAVQQVDSDDFKAWLLSTYNRCVKHLDVMSQALTVTGQLEILKSFQ